MLEILWIILPLFAIIAMGKAAIYWRFMDRDAAGLLSRFTLFVPTSALLFGLMAELTVSLGVSVVYLAGSLIVYAAALVMGRWLADSSVPHRAVFALDATFGNITFLGVPLILSVWGKEGLANLIGIIALATILIPISVILMEVGDNGRNDKSLWATVSGAGSGILKNPVIASMLLGFLWRITGIPVPPPFHNFLDLLGRAAPPLALFCLGTSLPAMSWEVVREGVSSTVLKLLAMPLAVGVLCYWAGFTDSPDLRQLSPFRPPACPPAPTHS